MASILWVPVIFCSASLYLYWLSIHHPALQSKDDEAQIDNSALKFPSSLEELQSLAKLLSLYRAHHFGYVLLLFSSAYLFKQTFAIPGSVFLNLLCGALFGQWIAFLLACTLSALGATLCFLMSKHFGKEYVIRYFPNQLEKVQKKIEENMDSLFFFLLFLRLFPMTPNWFLNMASPIFNIPVHLFFFSVFVGLMPYNFICVQTGVLLSQLTSLDNLLSVWTMLKLFAIANAALLPGIIIKHYHENRMKRRRSATTENHSHSTPESNGLHAPQQSHTHQKQS